MLVHAAHNILRLLGAGQRALRPQVSYAELYNENIYDLLNPAKDPTEISLSEDSKGCAVSSAAAARNPALQAER